MRALLILGLGVTLQAPATIPINTTAFTIGQPAAAAEIDLGTLKGELARLSWSPDGASLHVQTAEGAARHDYLVALDGTRTVASAPSEPEWAAQYWTMKSGMTAPGEAAKAITIVALKDSQKRDSSFLGGAPNLAGSVDREPTAEFDPVVIYRVHDEQIGRWVNKAAVPGETFGWGPEDTGLVAFVDARGQVILRGPRERQAIPNVKDALMPAWSRDGKRLAYVQKTGRRKYLLYWVSITPVL